jgi:hypothetical protein
LSRLSEEKYLDLFSSISMPTISIGKYLIHRLKEVGVETIFGVPGDYNMVLSKVTLHCAMHTLLIVSISLAASGPDRR